MNEKQWTPIKAWVKDMVDYLSDQYGVGDKMAPTVFRNRKGAAHYNVRVNGSKGHQLVFGYQGLEQWMAVGYKDYATVLPHISGLRGRRPKGLEALYWITIHEFAHVIQTENGQRWYGSVHNEHFIRYYQELSILFPFEEAAEMFQSHGLFGFEQKELEIGG